jgi:hypothetical protein
MKLFAKNYFSALLCVLLSLAAYQLVVVTAIEPTASPEPKIPVYSPIVGGERWWQGFFSEGAWQVENPTIVQNRRGVLLASSWEQIGPKTWKLEPLSMILPQTDRHADATQGSQGFSQQDVWIVSAQRGAIIHFDEPFDLRSGTSPSIERGQFDGSITITRRSIGKPNAKPWSLTTSDLSIDHRKISTQQEVSIQWDQSTVRGRDLSILLRRDILGGGPNDDDSSTWGPLDELEMIHVDELSVALPDGGLWAGVDPSLLAEQSSVRNLPARLEAICGGRFTFDFKSSVAALTGGVQMKHHLGQLPPDEFLAHKVTVRVGTPESQVPKAGSTAPVGGFEIREIVALGIDSLQNFVGEQWVDLQSPTLGASARAKKLRVDLEQQRIELAGKLDQPGATQSIALLQYQGYEFRSPSIEYQAAAADAQGKPEHVGWMFAEGPGELNTSASSQLGESQVRWQESLKMLPTETPGEQWVELLGNTLLENKTQGFMTAERLQVWLKKQISNTPANGPPTVNSTSPKSQFMPDRVLATGNTTLATPELKAHVGRLALQMVYAPNPGFDSSTKPNGLPLNDSKGNPMYSFVSPPQAAVSSQPSAVLAAQPPVRAKPITIHGQSLTTTVVSAGKQNWIDALTIDGPLTVHSAEEQTMTPMQWHIEGKQLLMASNAAGQVDLQINGEPARIVMADGALEGPTIRFDQLNNLIWMDQPGEFTIPLSVLNRSKGQLSSLQWVRPPHCQWQGRMIFDGSVARIDGDIEFDGIARHVDEYWRLKGYCQRLDLALSKSVDLSQAPRNRSTSDAEANAVEATVERIVLQDSVDLRIQQLDPQGDPKSLERIVVPILTFHVAEQKLVGGGTGWINSKFLSQGNGLGQLASRERGQQATQTLKGAHLAFRDSMVAFLDRNEVVFDGKVGLAVGPLDQWEDTIDPEEMTHLQLEQMLLSCDQLKIVDTSELSTTISSSPGSPRQAMEFQATGNVAFEGKAESGNYTGNGYQVTYVQVKDQLILRGDGQTPALVKKIPNDPQVESTWSNYVEEATINIKTLGVTNLQLSQSVVEFPQARNFNPSVSGPSPQQPNPRAGVSKFFQPQP